MDFQLIGLELWIAESDGLLHHVNLFEQLRIVQTELDRVLVSLLGFQRLIRLETNERQVGPDLGCLVVEYISFTQRVLGLFQLVKLQMNIERDWVCLNS